MSFEIFVDSSANIPAVLLKRHGMHLISYSFTIDGEGFSCSMGAENSVETAKMFYEKMRGGSDVKTSLLTQAAFEEALAPTLEAGKDVLLFTISSGVSGTHQQALMAKEALEKRFPARRICVLDSANASLGEGLQALKVADLRDMGEDVETCANWVRANAYTYNSYLTVGDLKYLKRTGRISTALAIAGSLLSIKPVLRADGNGKIVFFGKEHGRKKAISALVKAFDENAVRPESQTIAIAHADCEEEANELAETLKAHGARDVIVEYYDLCTGSHVGPGTIALFFVGKDRRGNAPAPEKSPAGKPVTERS